MKSGVLEKLIAQSRRIKIGARLTILVSVALAVTMIIAFTGMVNNKRLADSITFTYQAITRPLAAVAGARGEFNALRAALYDLTQDFNTDEQNVQFRQQVLENLIAYEENILLYRSVLNEYGSRDQYENEAIAYLCDQLEPLRLYVENIAQIGTQTGRRADAVLIMRGDFLKTADDISQDLACLTRILEAQTQAAHVYAYRLRRYNDQLSFAISSLGALSLLLIAWVIVESVTRPMEEIGRAAKRFARGHLDFSIRRRAKDEIGLLADGFSAAARELSVHLTEKQAAENAAHQAELARGKAEAATAAIVSGIKYASKIQKNLRPADTVFQSAFSDHHIIWKPRDIVGGDIYWMKNYGDGSILCVCDCTGHGTPGALLTMLVVSALEASVKESNYSDPAHILWRLDQQLAAVLNARQRKAGNGTALDFSDGCDIAIVFAAPGGEVRIASSGIPVFICDGKNVQRVRGQKLNIGEGLLRGPDTVKVSEIAPDPDNKFYIASDGLYDQIGGPLARPWGYSEFKKIILARHEAPLAHIGEKIWQAFEAWRNAEARRDDLELIAFQLGTV